MNDEIFNYEEFNDDSDVVSGLLSSVISSVSQDLLTMSPEKLRPVKLLDSFALKANITELDQNSNLVMDETMLDDSTNQLDVD